MNDDDGEDNNHSDGDDCGYESFSDVGKSRVWFASKNLTPCRKH